ncbi:hypothetical protein, partial [Ralstonia pickettii]|uniref:hypothetical protein n=1 Tax=Ralstonia pickettii TaxID=329 RepID=UPI002D78BAE3
SLSNQPLRLILAEILRIPADPQSAAAQTVSAPVMKEDDGGRIGTWVTITVAERGRAVAQSPDHGKGLAA